MQCQNCDRPMHPADERCPNCGAKPLHRRVVFGAPQQEFTLTHEDPFELDESAGPDDRQFPARPVPSARELIPQTDRYWAETVRYGGFVRRAVALLVDVVVIILLIGIMSLMSFVAYKAGLSAHGRTVDWTNMAPLLVILGWAAMLLTTCYFTIFHGLEGKTIGKWFLRLRVVGAGHTEISYLQAFLRWIAMVGFAPTVLGPLWILWSREKRAWHDYAARTWVVYE